jgi:Leucine-rich repeat (LRR) protein
MSQTSTVLLHVAMQGPFLASLNASSLVSLSCRQCQLSGSLPSGSDYLQLTTLDLADNALIGTLPASWQEVKNLVSLDLSGNGISSLIATNLPVSMQSLIIRGGNISVMPAGEVH